MNLPISPFFHKQSSSLTVNETFPLCCRWVSLISDLQVRVCVYLSLYRNRSGRLTLFVMMTSRKTVELLIYCLIKIVNLDRRTCFCRRLTVKVRAFHFGLSLVYFNEVIDFES